MGARTSLFALSVLAKGLVHLADLGILSSAELVALHKNAGAVRGIRVSLIGLALESVILGLV